MAEKRYTEGGWLIVSELGCCQYFEKDKSATCSCSSKDCFFCKFSDFRKQEYIEQVKTDARKGILYSVCHNVKNKQSQPPIDPENDPETNY